MRRVPENVLGVCEAHAQLVVWRENDFPYSLEGDVEHHVLWTTGELTEQAGGTQQPC